MTTLPVRLEFFPDVPRLSSLLPQSDAIKAAASRFAERLKAFPRDIKRFRIRLNADRTEQRGSIGPFVVHTEIEPPNVQIVVDEASDIDVHVALINAFRETQLSMQQVFDGQRAMQTSCAPPSMASASRPSKFRDQSKRR